MSGKLDSVELDLYLPFFHVKGTWKPDGREKMAAWELFVELVTRISFVELKDGEGILQEALSSLYSLFKTTRQVLRKYGPSVATPHQGADYSLARLAIDMLNFELRPILAKWHPLLEDYEKQRDRSISIKVHEDKWEMNRELRMVLDELRKVLIQYSNYLAKASGIEPMFDEKKEKAD
jgi:hypothetical protein